MYFWSMAKRKGFRFWYEKSKVRILLLQFGAYNSVGLEYTPDKRKVSSSNLLKPNLIIMPIYFGIVIWVISSIGRVFRLHRKC